MMAAAVTWTLCICLIVLPVSFAAGVGFGHLLYLLGV